MKKVRLVGCLLVFLLSILSVDIALGQETARTNHTQQTSANHSVVEENTEKVYAVSLPVDGGWLRLLIPNGYQLQEYELSDIEEYPFSYVFAHEKTQAQFVVYSGLDNEKNQGIWLRKLFDKSNKFIVSDGVLIGEHTYLVYTKEQATYDYGFLICAGKGYSYQFQYILPYDCIQNEIPAEAISILSTLEIQEFPAYAD